MRYKLGSPTAKFFDEVAEDIKKGCLEFKQQGGRIYNVEPGSETQKLLEPVVLAEYAEMIKQADGKLTYEPKSQAMVIGESLLPRSNWV